MKIICLVNSILLSIATGAFINGFKVDGHSFVQVSEDGMPIVLRCQRCDQEVSEAS